MPDLGHIYDMLKDQNEVMRKQAETLSAIAQSQNDTRERLFGGNGQPGALHYLNDEIGKTNAVVAKHSSQIIFWRGALAVMSFLLTTAVAWAGIVLGKHR